MYYSNPSVIRKQRQALFAFNKLKKFEGRIFVKDGEDPETRCNVLIFYLSAFLSNSRSVFQCAREQALFSGQQAEYDRFLAEHPIIGFFKDIRDDDTHSLTVGSHTSVATSSPIESFDRATGVLKTKPSTFHVEALSDLDSVPPSNDEVEITRTISRGLAVDDKLIAQLESEGKPDLAAAASQGKELYKTQDFNGEKDLFKLCEMYVEVTDDFVRYGVEVGFISDPPPNKPLQPTPP